MTVCLGDSIQFHSVFTSFGIIAGLKNTQTGV